MNFNTAAPGAQRRSSSSTSSSSGESSAEVAVNVVVNARDSEPEDEGDHENKLGQVKDDSSVAGLLELEAEQVLEADAMVVRLSRDKQICAVGLANGDIRLFHLTEVSNTKIVVRMRSAIEVLPCTDLQFVTCALPHFSSRKNMVLASYASGYIRLWQYTVTNTKSNLFFEWREKAIESVSMGKQDEFNQILCLSASYDNQRFITGGTDCVIKVYEYSSKLVVRTLKSSLRRVLSNSNNYHTNRITALRYHPRGHRDTSYIHIFVSAGWDDSVQIWDDRHSGSLWQYYGPHVAGGDGLDIDPLNNCILTCSWRRERSILQLWKFPEFAIHSKTLHTTASTEFFRKPIHEVVHRDTATASQGYVAQYDGTYQYVVFAGSNKNLLKVIDIESNLVLGELRGLLGGVYSATLCLDPADKRRLVVIFTTGKTLFLGFMDTRHATRMLRSS